MSPLVFIAARWPTPVDTALVRGGLAADLEGILVPGPLGQQGF